MRTSTKPLDSDRRPRTRSGVMMTFATRSRNGQVGLADAIAFLLYSSITGIGATVEEVSRLLDRVRPVARSTNGRRPPRREHA
jgi:hypothetical protein